MDQRNGLEKFKQPEGGMEKYVPYQYEEEEPAKGVRDFLTIFFKHKKKIVSIFLATVLAVTIVTFLLPPTYEAKSSLMVLIGREHMNRSGMGAGDQRSTMSLHQEAAEVLNSEIPILTSQALIQKVLSAMKVETIYPGLVEDPPDDMTPMDAAILNVQKKLTVAGVKKSNVIEVSFQHRDPKVAARFVNLLVELYKDMHLEIFSDPQSSFIDNQVAQFEQKLKQSESEMETFKQSNRVFSLEEQRTLLLQQRNELDTNLKNTQNQVDELSKRISSLRSQKESHSKDKTLYAQTERDMIIVDTKSKLLTLQLQEQQLLKQYNDDNRLVRDIREEIKFVQNFLKEQEAEIYSRVRVANPISQGVEMDLIRAQADYNSQVAKASALMAQLAKIENEIRSFNLLENDYHALKRDVESNERNYRTYAERMEEARISDEMNRRKMVSISVIHAATPPVEKLKPKKAVNMLLGILLGIMASLGYVLFSEYTSQKFSTPELAERRLGLPVLTTIMHKD